MSTFKVLVVGAILRKARRSDRDLLDRRVRWKQADLVPYSPVTEKHTDIGLTVAQLCDAAITRSDNTAGNLLLKQIGGPQGLTRFARSLADPFSRLDWWEVELDEWRPGEGRDTTTPGSMGRNLHTLTVGDALARPDRARLIRWMRANTTGDHRIRAGLPGELDRRRQDRHLAVLRGRERHCDRPAIRRPARDHRDLYQPPSRRRRDRGSRARDHGHPSCPRTVVVGVLPMGGSPGIPQLARGSRHERTPGPARPTLTGVTYVPPAVTQLADRLAALGWVVDLFVAGSLAMGDYVPGVSDLDLVALTDGRVDELGQAILAKLHRDLDGGPAAGLDLGCVYVDANELPDGDARHPTWTHGSLVHRIVSGVTRAELVRHGFAIMGRPPATVFPDMTDDDVRRAARAELCGYWAWASRRPLMWLDPVIADLGLTSMARGRYALETGQLLTKTQAIERAHAPAWLRQQLGARRRGEVVVSPRARTAFIAWRDARRTVARASRTTLSPN